MVGKRKRPGPCQEASSSGPRQHRSRKRRKVQEHLDPANAVIDDSVKHPLLSLYYPRIVTLRTYLLETLPVSAKKNRRKIALLGRPNNGNKEQQSPGNDQGEGAPLDRTAKLAELLDTTLVGLSKRDTKEDIEKRMKDFVEYSQTQVGSTIGSSLGTGNCSQSEVRGWIFEHRRIAI